MAAAVALVTASLRPALEPYAMFSIARKLRLRLSLLH